MVATLTLRTTYPCCGKRARIAAVAGVPRERYDRVCEQCDTRWEVLRRGLTVRGAQVDLLEWVDAGPASR